ncbi:MAG: DUF1320 domain-containing protein [Chitinophagales bacterium]|nr:DUF1320 domain-containing protein [Chitinophagales bacterium]
MTFLQPEELKSAIYQYRVDDITESDEDIVLIAIEAAIQEVQSYFTPNFKPEWSDGRLIYDVEAIFSASGNERNPLILQHTKTIAVWNLIELSNVDMIFEQVRIRYERAVEWLKDFASGKVTLNNLPLKEVEILDDDGQPMQREPFKFGSRKKFNHE